MSTFSEKWQEIKGNRKKLLVFILLCLLLTCGTGLLVVQGLSGGKDTADNKNKKEDKTIPTLNSSDTITQQSSKINTYNDHLKDQEEALNNFQNQKSDFEKLFADEDNKKEKTDYSTFGEKQDDYLVKNSGADATAPNNSQETSTNTKSLRTRTAKSTETIIYSQNQISAVIHNWNREIRSGSNVRIRTTEEFKANGIIIPKNTDLYAVASAQGERMKMIITGVNLNNEVVPLNLEVFDYDGVSGLHIPTHLQREIVNDGVDKITDGTKTTIKMGTFGEVTTNLGNKAKNNPNIIVNDGYKIFLKPKK